MTIHNNNDVYVNYLICMQVPPDVDDIMLTATVSSVWNASYALGWALGPLMGGVLVDMYGFSMFSTIITWVCFGFGCLMTAAACINLRPSTTYTYTPVPNAESPMTNGSYGTAQMQGSPSNRSNGESSPLVLAAPPSSVVRRPRRASSMSSDGDLVSSSLYHDYTEGQMANEEGLLPGSTLPAAAMIHRRRSPSLSKGDTDVEMR